MNSDCEIVQGSLTTAFPTLLKGLVYITIVLFILVSMSAKLTGVIFGSIFAIIILCVPYFIFMYQFGKKIQEEKAAATTIAEESITNVRTVKAFNNEEFEIGRFRAKNEKVMRLGKRKALYDSIFVFALCVIVFGTFGLVIWNSYKLYSEGKITVGDIFLFISYLLGLMGNFGGVAGVIAQLAQMAGAADKIMVLIDHKSKVNAFGGDKMEDDSVRGTIELRDVKFTYPCRDDVAVLKGISLKVDPDVNRVVALCGTSGCGKSSTIAMIERFYDPDEGTVLFNGRDIRELDPRWYHQQIAIVQQEPVLFSGSILDNITFGIDLDGMTEEEVETLVVDACKQANAH